MPERKDYFHLFREFFSKALSIALAFLLIFSSLNSFAVKAEGEEADISEETEETVETETPEEVVHGYFDEENPILTDLCMITKQPEDIHVNWPEPAHFSVEVDHPELIDHYQWAVYDGAHVIYLTGESASTPDLVIPATVPIEGAHIYFCEMQDLDGHWLVTDDAYLYIDNWAEKKPVVYVGEYAVEPGESIDLAEKNMGSGKVTYDKNAEDLTLDNVHYDNSTTIYDPQFGPSTGILWNSIRQGIMEYRLHLIGENVFINHMYDEEYESGGVDINLFYGTSGDYYENYPTVIIEGPGTLNCQGGEYCIYADTHMMIRNTEITHVPLQGKGDGIDVLDLDIEDSVINLTGTGSGINADYLTIGDGVKINIDIAARRSFRGVTSIGCIDGYNIQCGKADLNLHVSADPDDLIPYGTILNGIHAILSSYEETVFDGTNINIEMEVGESDTMYALTADAFAHGVFTRHVSNLSIINGAQVKVKMDMPDTVNARGFHCENDVTIKDSSVELETTNRGEAIGIDAFGKVLIEDSNVDITAVSTDKRPEILPQLYHVDGIAAGSLEVNLSSCGYKVHFRTENQFDPAKAKAIAITNEELTEEPVYTEGYTPRFILPGEGVHFRLPEEAEINLAKRAVNETEDRAAETVYDIGGSEPVIALDVIFEGEHSWGEWTVTKEPTAAAEGEEQRVCAICGETEVRSIPKLDPEAVSYSCTKGDGSSWTKGSKSSLSFTFRRSADDSTAFSHFKGIQVDGKDVSADKYTAKSGSVVIDLKPAYLETLNIGEHTLTALFDDADSVTVKFTVKAASTPDTGDSNHTGMWGALLAIAAAAAVCALFLRRKAG